MLKRVISFLLVALAFVPALSFAAEKEYKTLNLAGALLEEGIDAKLGNYKESDDKVTVYLFRGKGCGFCRGFLTYLNDHIEDLGKYYNLLRNWVISAFSSAASTYTVLCIQVIRKFPTDLRRYAILLSSFRSNAFRFSPFKTISPSFSRIISFK